MAAPEKVSCVVTLLIVIGVIVMRCFFKGTRFEPPQFNA
jgi:hypothetical protein